jgi:hypothetical protein
MLRLGRGFNRESIRRSLEREEPLTVTYNDILEEADIREAVLGIRDAGSPSSAQPILAWLCSHPNTPEDILRDLAARGAREILMSLALNPHLPEDLATFLANHEDPEVRDHANHVQSRRKA